ncbi:MAG: aspartate/glutamate racemase family protein [Desulfobacterales bacterium]
MQTIGLLGGMSWESSIEYYRIVNEKVNERLGGLHSARCLLYSVNFGEIEPLMATGQWEEITERLVQAARSLELAGADFLVICTNTMHKIAPQIQAAVGIPLLHIADAVASRIRSAGMRSVALLGTRFTMVEDFYRKRLAEQHGLRVSTPTEGEIETVDRVIFEELCRGKIVDASRAAYRAIVERMAGEGAQAVILGCTEIGLLIKEGDCSIPLFDTTRIHAEAAVDFAMQEI